MFSRFLLCVFLLQAATSFAEESRRWALLIGVNEYTELQSLTYAGKDMQALAEQIKASGFEDNRTVLMHDGAADKKSLPFRANIERELDLLVKRVKKDDLLLVAFSGHGLFLDGKSYFCPTEAQDGEPEKTLISVDAVYKQLETCPAALKILLVDACRNDPRPASRKSATPKVDLQKLGATFERPPEGLVVFSSCGPGQISWEDEKLGHGVFMNFFLQGLSGEADTNKNGKVSLEELFEFSCDKTEDFVALKRSDFQRPARKGEINGKFEFSPRVVPATSVVPTTIENSIGIKLVQIPAGTFTMGSAESEIGRKSNEKQVEVTLTKSFYLGQTEVTQGQWKAVMSTEPWKGRSTEGVQYPVTYVSWDDSQEFCRKLSSKDGKQYRLPTEAEWEYACRGGTKTRYSFGDDDRGLSEHGWWASGGKTEHTKYSHEVGLKKPNPFGLYDMHGNVWEWCSDWYAEEMSDDTDPFGPTTGSYRVDRGGGWSSSPSLCRSAYRDRSVPNLQYGGLGFRVACSSQR